MFLLKSSIRLTRFAFFKGRPNTLFKRQSNQETIDNARHYLSTKKGEIEFAKNESGFIRMIFPSDVLKPDTKIAPLGPRDSLRANYWFYDEDEKQCGMGDESIHDHPRFFESFIVQGGYEHELYQTLNRLDEINYFFSAKHLNDLYQLFISEKNISDVYGFNSFKFSFDKIQKKISYQGTVTLKKIGVQTTGQGDTVIIDSEMIHRVSQYHIIPKQKTLSLNIVRNVGKFHTNIFLPDKKVASVKTERELVCEKDALRATDELIDILSKTVIRQSNESSASTHNQDVIPALF